MPTIVSNLISFITDLLAAGGYVLLSIVVVLEGLPLIGSIFPGHVLLVASGFFSKIGVLNIWVVLIVAIVSAALGDIIGFLIGRKWGFPFMQKYGKYVLLKQSYLDKAKALIDAHTGKTIVLGKFSPVTRPLMPFVVGASGVHIRTFWIYNILGGLLWVVLSVGIGYGFGAGYHVAAQYMGKFLVLATLASVIIVWGYKFVNVRFHVFRKYELFILALNLVSLWALLKTMQDGLSLNSFLANFDVTVNIFVNKHMLQWMQDLARWISALGGVETMLTLGLFIGFMYVVHHKWRRGGIMILSVALPAVVVPIVKEIFLRSRPENAIAALWDTSFPSGHAAFAAAFFVALMYVLAPSIKSWVKREAFIVLGVLAIFAVGVSRIILNVHWASDVIAGWALGMFLATSSVLVVRYVAGILLRDNK